MGQSHTPWPPSSVAEMWRLDEERRQKDRMERAEQIGKSAADQTARALLADQAWQARGLSETAERWGVATFMRQTFINAWLDGFETAHQAQALQGNGHE